MLTLALSACDEAMMNASCDATPMQALVGRDAVDAIKFMSTQDSNAYFVGHDEVLDETIPHNALLIELNIDEVHAPEDLIGAKVDRVFCKP